VIRQAETSKICGQIRSLFTDTNLLNKWVLVDYIMFN